MNFISKWCKNEGLGINPTKTVVIPFTRRRALVLPNLVIRGITIEFSTEVKYLGITLDRKLNWNVHLNNVLNKGINALWVCKKTFGKKWGLRPKMIYWLYTCIVRPRITYASLVWWPKVKEKNAQNKLAKLQRLATISTTGAMHSTSSAALNSLLNLLPLHKFIELEAFKSASLMNRSTRIQDEDLTGHLEVLKNFTLDPALNSIVDWMPTKANYDIPFTVDAKSRCEWDNGGPNLRPGSIVFYTDGSKMNNRTGAGVYGPGIKIFFPMGQYPTVFQAEVYAIIECLHICLKRNYRFANICIFSDSLAALNALKGYTCQSRLVWEGIILLKQLSQKTW